MNRVKRFVYGVVFAAVALGATSVANADNVWTYYAAGADGNPTDWFKNAALGIDVVRAMVSGVTAVAASKNQDKNCTIYCSKRMGWKELASPLEGDYESVLAPEGCFGVLVDASGNRRAWMVHRASPYDKSGLMIFVR